METAEGTRGADTVEVARVSGNMARQNAAADKVVEVRVMATKKMTQAVTKGW